VSCCDDFVLMHWIKPNLHILETFWVHLELNACAVVAGGANGECKAVAIIGL
jgi:hypothetical protein